MIVIIIITIINSLLVLPLVFAHICVGEIAI